MGEKNTELRAHGEGGKEKERDTHTDRTAQKQRVD